MKTHQHKIIDLLMIFDFVSSHGTLKDRSYHYKGLEVWHDLGGYMCWLSYKDLTITLSFHSIYSFDFDKTSTLEEFYQLSDLLLKSK